MYLENKESGGRIELKMKIKQKARAADKKPLGHADQPVSETSTANTPIETWYPWRGVGRHSQQQQWH